jgi:transcription-repair coupling factor (superfamily II helicase)
MVLPLDHGFTAPDVAVLTEQDMLGDRLVRRRKKRKGAAAFLSELATLSPVIWSSTRITASAATRG